ncbi:LAME_0H00364g1_1 [Lachancea meyersii CBS 8951]|uniref:LAME_0H00364g1_1 n=1 Tax=Lachancea meyersii CBS 8951 TaxID=1266667 RepID=A0A1G4KD37_9SACH|nr:LAME_0H00364g1_1 [Lachancea meyersii CBS 8951]
MRFSHVLSSAALAGVSLATPLGHEHPAHKRDVAYVTNVRTTTVFGTAPQQIGGQSTTVALDASNTVAQQAATESTSLSEISRGVAAAPTEAVSSTVSFSSSSSSSSSSTSAAASSGSSVPASSSSSSSAAATSSSSAGSAGAKGITYSPYSSSGSCKSSSEIASDLAQLSGYDIIRLYGVDCDQVSAVLQNKASSQKLFLGIYYTNAIQDGVNTIKSAIEAHGSWDDVYAVSIGNELVNGGEATVAQVGSYVSEGRSALTSAGYSGPVVSVDTFIAVINNPGLCDHSDFMAVNAHAYFDYNTAAEDSGTWLVEQIQRVWGACQGNKEVLITESGWPSQGDTLGKAVPSKENQASAISSIKSSCGSAVILFTAFNDYWKADGAYGCEKYWGILSN